MAAGKGCAARALELSAPARDLACGVAAIDAGADSVYIGARAFGARLAAGNPTEEIRRLADYAHRFHARVYAALNTVLYDAELDAARELIHELYAAGADALIVQDMGILEMDLPPIPLFASTQADIRDGRKARFLEEVGFSRVILARELTLDEIREIRARTAVELECFIAGALCAGVSGQCRFSLAVCGRSANRGECAQPCRGRYSVEDAGGRILERDRHPLSLRDLDLVPRLLDLVQAGVTAFKIEGRLKDAAYVSNMTAYCRRALDAVIGSVPGLARASDGEVSLSFEPDPERTFSRGRTGYCIEGRPEDAVFPLTPKSIGKPVGTVAAVRKDHFILRGGASLNNGDGICLFDRRGALRGTFVTRARGERIYPRDPRIFCAGAALYRNRDRGFLAALSRTPPTRRIPVRVVFRETRAGFSAVATDPRGVAARVEAAAEKVPARSIAKAAAAIQAHFSKLGGTPYAASAVDAALSRPLLLKASFLNAMRRELVARLDEARSPARPGKARAIVPNRVPYPGEERDHRLNVSNRLARRFYARHGAVVVADALELSGVPAGTTVLTARACVRKRLGLCPRRGGEGPPSAAPLFLADARRRHRLEFDCDRCEMRVVFQG
ncbi:MAG TPA: U32 family peptidase [bacterium]|nr:U32 family peptidase [Chlamydiota bacterium]HOE26917.1 U32 family peptidase [bacterium]HQM51821.1 U32 family peptidase [bacterium]